MKVTRRPQFGLFELRRGHAAFCGESVEQPWLILGAVRRFRNFACDSWDQFSDVAISAIAQVTEPSAFSQDLPSPRGSLFSAPHAAGRHGKRGI